jgi:hypothetical protein
MNTRFQISSTLGSSEWREQQQQQQQQQHDGQRIAAWLKSATEWREKTNM